MISKNEYECVMSAAKKTQPLSCDIRDLLTYSLKPQRNAQKKGCLLLLKSIHKIVSHYMEISGMALEHAHFQFSRMNQPTDRASERASEQTDRPTARQHTSHEPCECVHPLANTKIMTIERQQHYTHANSQWHRYTANVLRLFVFFSSALLSSCKCFLL